MPRHDQIGIFIDPMHGYRDPLLAGVCRYIREHQRRWRPIVSDTETPRLAELLAGWRGDGILYSATNDLMAAAFAQRRGQVPAVNVSGSAEAPVHSVISDNHLVGHLAAEHLLEHAFPRYAFVGGSQRWATDRRDGYLARLREAGLECEQFDSGAAAFTGLRQMIEEARPVGVFASDDTLALSVMHQCLAAGLAVPRDVAFLGAGNWRAVCELGPPTLSSVEVDYARRGYHAAAMLDALMAGRKVVGPVQVPPREVVERESTAVFGYKQATLRRAVEFIALHAEASITVKAVTTAAGVSRRTLEQQFADVLRRSIHDEIWRQHVACAKRLLANSELSMSEIARRCGFSSASSFSTVFQRHTRHTPRDYRVQFGQRQIR